MISGTVTGDQEIVIQLEDLNTGQSAVSIQAVVDTGFNGFLTLPIDVLNAVGASAAGTRREERGDGNLVELDVCVARVNWHDENRDVLALSGGRNTAGQHAITVGKPSRL